VGSFSLFLLGKISQDSAFIIMKNKIDCHHLKKAPTERQKSRVTGAVKGVEHD
jgi:hypothetical protein